MPEITVMPFDEMTPEQREFTVYMYAGMYMTQVLGWPETPPEVGKRLDELQHCWGDVSGSQRPR